MITEEPSSFKESKICDGEIGFHLIYFVILQEIFIFTSKGSFVSSNQIELTLSKILLKGFISNCIVLSFFSLYLHTISNFYFIAILWISVFS